MLFSTTVRTASRAVEAPSVAGSPLRWNSTRSETGFGAGRASRSERQPEVAIINATNAPIVRSFMALLLPVLAGAGRGLHLRDAPHGRRVYVFAMGYLPS